MRLSDGTEITFRTARPDEGPALDQAFAELSDRSRYLRFHTPVPRLSPELRRRLLDLDGTNRLAVLAVGPHGQPIGVARYARSDGEPAAEIGVAIADAWQARGVGTALVRELARIAREQGIERFDAYALRDNVGARRLLTGLGAKPRSDPDEPEVVAYSLEIHQLAPDAGLARPTRR